MTSVIPRSVPTAFGPVLIAWLALPGCGDDGGNLRFDAGVDAGRRDAGTDAGAIPEDAGPEDAGPGDAGPQAFGLPLCNDDDPRVTLLTFTGSVDIALEQEPPRTLATGDGVGGRRGSAVIRYAGDREIAWVAESASDADVVAERALVGTDGSIFVAYRVTVRGTEAVTFQNADGSDGVTYSRPRTMDAPFFPEPGGSFASNNQQCFVVRYDEDGNVGWSRQVGFVNGPVSERACEPRGLATSGPDIVFAAYLRSSPGGVRDTEIQLAGVNVPADSGPVLAVVRLDVTNGNLVRDGTYYVDRAEGFQEHRAPDRAGAGPGVDLAGSLDPGEPTTTRFQIQRLDLDPVELPADAASLGYLTRFTRSTGEPQWTRTIVGGRPGVGQHLVGGDGTTLLVGFTDDLVEGPTTFSSSGADFVLNPSLGTWLVRYGTDGGILWTQRFGWADDPTAPLFPTAMAGRTETFARDDRIVVSGTARGTAMDVTFGDDEDAPALSLGRDEAYVAFLELSSGRVVGVSRHTTPLVPMEARGDAPRFDVAGEPGDVLFADGEAPVDLSPSGGVRTTTMVRVSPANVPVCAFPVAQGIDVEMTSFTD